MIKVFGNQCLRASYTYTCRVCYGFLVQLNREKNNNKKKRKKKTEKATGRPSSDDRRQKGSGKLVSWKLQRTRCVISWGNDGGGSGIVLLPRLQLSSSVRCCTVHIVAVPRWLYNTYYPFSSVCFCAHNQQFRPVDEYFRCRCARTTGILLTGSSRGIRTSFIRP